jgi:hypothetical protein
MNNNNIFCENIKYIYHTKCNEFVIAEIAELELKFIALFIGLSGIVYLKNNKYILSELLFKIGYNTFLAAAKVSNVYRRVKNFFVSSSPAVVGENKKIYIYDEVKVIRNGIRCASFETMKTFKESNYLGNPNDYYDIDEVVEDSTTSSSFDSDLVTDASCSCSSSPSSSSSRSCQEYSSSSESESSCSLEPLFVIEKNDNNQTVEFKRFDFIMHTNYKYPESFNASKQNYTKIYRKFTETDYNADKNKYEISNTEIIICILKIDGDDSEYEYEIDISKPYNFNIVGNLILDEKFVYWYILKKYNYVIEPSMNYNITCITNDCKEYELDRSCGLRVHLNDYEKSNKSSEFLRSTYFLHL